MDKPKFLEYESLKTFPTWKESLEWALQQVEAGGPKYFVHRTDDDTGWEAIQAWIQAM